MSDAAGELSDRFHFLRLEQLVFQTQLFFGNVFEGKEMAMISPIAVDDPRHKGAHDLRRIFKCQSGRDWLSGDRFACPQDRTKAGWFNKPFANDTQWQIDRLALDGAFAKQTFKLTVPRRHTAMGVGHQNASLMASNDIFKCDDSCLSPLVRALTLRCSIQFQPKTIATRQATMEAAKPK